MIHFKDISSPNYPHSSCGTTGLAIRKTEEQEEVTCTRCLKYMKEGQHGKRT